jgi:hypothetical protein
VRKLKLPAEIRLLADSTNIHESRITSFLFPLPTVLLAELRTHRLLRWSSTDIHDLDFSINANSDRAIPIEKKIQAVKDFPYLPIPTRANKGMSADEKTDDTFDNFCDFNYKLAMEQMIYCAEILAINGASKQYVNRLLYPFSWSFVVVTGDNVAWKAFFDLRTKSDVEPNFRQIAKELESIYKYDSTPNFLKAGEWHLTFIEEIQELELKIKRKLSLKEKIAVSGSCNARISYDINRDETLEKHLERFQRCVDSGHISITEHQATSYPNIYDEKEYSKFKSNVNNWVLARKFIENDIDL